VRVSVGVRYITLGESEDAAISFQRGDPTTRPLCRIVSSARTLVILSSSVRAGCRATEAPGLLKDWMTPYTPGRSHRGTSRISGSRALVRSLRLDSWRSTTTCSILHRWLYVSRTCAGRADSRGSSSAHFADCSSRSRRQERDMRRTRPLYADRIAEKDDM